jgi:NAD-dependent dihydropyrimidine dehydrogenase PreA subunit
MNRDWTRQELEDDYVGKMKVVTIPVNLTIEGSQRILDMSELKQILENAEVISLQECYCRKRLKNCIDPMDGCISLDDEALDALAKNEARRVSVEEALATMERTYDAGLVHMAYTFEGQDKIGIICSCCSCCCHSLSAALRFGYSDHVISSNLMATHDQDKCIDCGVCVKRCQFGARLMIDGKLTFHEEKCFGCGLCLRTCNENAIAMIERT